MQENQALRQLQIAIQTAADLQKCRVCACMKKSLQTIKGELLKVEGKSVAELVLQVDDSIDKMEEAQYT